MNMNFQDDRTEKERETHKFLIVGTDSFMSGWGEAKGMTSYAAWACTESDRRNVLAWVRRRSDMKRVREVYGDYSPKRRGLLHVYVVKAGHPALAFA
jgi:hypothetical protein